MSAFFVNIKKRSGSNRVTVLIFQTYSCGRGVAYPRGKNFITFEAVELLILNFYVASKTFLKLKQHRPAASAHAQRIHFKIWLGMANQLIVILRQHLRFSGF